MKTTTLGSRVGLCAVLLFVLTATCGCPSDFTFESFSGFVNDLLDSGSPGDGEPNEFGEPNDVNDDDSDDMSDDDSDDMSDDDSDDMDDDDSDDADDDDADDVDDDDPNSAGAGGGDQTGGQGGLQGDVAAGQAIYEADCASCHALGSFDTSGSFGDLSGRSGRFVNDFGTISSAMGGLVYTDQELADLIAFVDAN